MHRLALIFLLLGSVLFAQKSLTINTGWYPPERELVKEILDELFARTNIDYTLQQLAPERAIKNANLGLDDGDAVRIFEVVKIFPHLRRVNEHFFTAAFSVFYINKSLSVETVDDLRNKRVAIVNGTKIVEKFVKKNKFTQAEKTLNYEEAFLKLLSKEVSIVILNRRPALSAIKKMHLEKVIIEHKPPLIQKKMYLYLHNKHEKLIPSLEKSLKQMKRDGSYQKAIENYLIKLPSERGIIDAK